ncbi:extracellular solute-binding protein [Paenibacillus sp. HB172176]|uniref:extracellular solute-binding protein n=1 Tax=Paenibacillus sp. HB172176 TaxID=2493690 RepID=UPI001438BD0E|nr:extracellular solute-binding protein [Paenibacillus sp. HB172176]
MRVKARKGLTALTISILVVASALAGCSNNTNGNTNATKAPSVTKNTNTAVENIGDNKDNGDKPLWDFKYDPPVTITTALIDEDRPNAFKQGETLEDNIHSEWMEENLGIITKYEWTVGKPEDYQTKLQLALATNVKLPDTFYADGDVLQNLITAGKLMPINDAIDKYASPTLKAVFEKYPYVLGELSRDGKIYGIPRFFMGDEGTVMWLRKDWLDKLSLEAPTTLDELETVMKAFSEEDPNGNGQDDEVGWAVPLKEGPWTWMGQSDAIFGAYTEHMINTYDIKSYWNEDENGNLVYGAVHPDAKKYLETMRDWMSKGYIDSEAGVKDPSKSAELAASGKAGLMFGPYWMGAWPLSDTEKIDPNADWEPYPLPAGPDGEVRLAQKTLYGGGLVFRKDFDNIEAWFAYYNKILAKAAGPDDPYYDPRFKDGFHEGYDYVTYNGKVYTGNYKEAGVPEDKWPLPDGNNIDMRWMVSPLFGTNTPQVPYMNTEAIEKFVANPDAEAATPIEVSVKSLNSAQLQGAGINVKQREYEVPNLFTGAATPTMKKNGEFLQKLATETYLQIIYGEKPLDYFDQFVKEWNKNGGEKITAEVNEWYKNNK